MSDADVQQGITVDLVLQYGLSAPTIYALYSTMGGMSTWGEVRGYLQGLSALPQLQRDLVAHAVNVHLNDLFLRKATTRAPYSSADVGAAAGLARSEFDGERLAEHRRWHQVGGSPLEDDAESERLASLNASGLLTKPLTGTLERLPRMAQEHFGVMGAAINLITADRQVTKAAAGLARGEVPRDYAFCNETIRFDRTHVIPDAHQDPRYFDNELVRGEPHIRFYAGHPIQGPGNMRVGSLCIIDDNPRAFDAGDERKLRTLAALVQLEIWTPETSAAAL